MLHRGFCRQGLLDGLPYNKKGEVFLFDIEYASGFAWTGLRGRTVYVADGAVSDTFIFPFYTDFLQPFFPFGQLELLAGAVDPARPQSQTMGCQHHVADDE